MEPELPEVDEITQALDYLADQNYTNEQIALMTDILTKLDPNTELDNLKENFAGKRGVITRLRTVLNFVEKYRENKELIEELKSEMEYLIAGIDGSQSGGISF